MAKFENWFLRSIQGFTQSKIEKGIFTLIVIKPQNCYPINKSRNTARTSRKRRENAGKSKKNGNLYALTPIIFLNIFQSKVHIIIYLYSIWDNLKMVFLCYQFCKNRGVFTISGVSSILRSILLAAFNKAENFTSNMYFFEVYFFGAFNLGQKKAKNIVNLKNPQRAPLWIFRADISRNFIILSIENTCTFSTKF